MEAGEWSKHVLRIGVYCGSFFTIGWALALPGAALSYLAVNVATKEKRLGVLFTMRGAGYASSSLLGGFLGEALDVTDEASSTHLVMAASMFLASLGMWSASRATTVGGLGLALTTSSVAMGALDTVGNMATLRSCERARSSASAPMSLVHACFGVGCVAGPASIRHVLKHNASPELAAFDACALAAAVCSVALYVVPGVSLRTTKPVPCEPSLRAYCSGGINAHSLTIMAASLLLFTYVGVEQGTGALLSTWAYRSLGRGRRRAYEFTTYFWLAMVAGRLGAGLTVPDDLRADLLVLSATVVSSLAGAALTFVDETNVANFWLSAVLFCLGCAYGPIYPVAFARLEARLGGGLSATFGGVVVAMGGLGEMAVPLLTFRAWKRFGAVAFGTAISVLSFVCVVCWAVVLKTTSRSDLELFTSCRGTELTVTNSNRRQNEPSSAVYVPLGRNHPSQIGLPEMEMEDSCDEDDVQSQSTDDYS